MCAAPSVRVAASMLPTAVGAGGTTVTPKDCSTLPPAFVAVTVIVALPRATAVTVTSTPSTAIIATSAFEDSAVYVTPSPAK